MALGDWKSGLAKHSHPCPTQNRFQWKGALGGSAQCKVRETSGEKNFGGKRDCPKQGYMKEATTYALSVGTSEI